MSTGADYEGKTVVVGLTGRLASGVAALLLKKQGMNVIGVSILTNSNDQFKSASDYMRQMLSRSLKQRFWIY